MYCKKNVLQKKHVLQKHVLQKKSPTNVLEKSQAISPERMIAPKQPHWVSLGKRINNRNCSKANI